MHDRLKRDESALHTVSGRWKLGMALSVLTMLVWATLPIALRSVLLTMEAVTVAWYRFVVAALLMTVWLTAAGKLPRLATLRGPIAWLMLAGGVGMAGNYLFFLLGLKYTSPAAAQVVIQLAPMFLLAGAVAFFKEAFALRQWLGALILGAGLVLFFNQRLGELTAIRSSYGMGVLSIVAASVLWAGYAMAQKQLLRTHSSLAITFVMYWMGLTLLAPMASPAQLGALSAVQLGLLAYCSINTVVGYGCFAEALAHWEASKVSAVIATTPLFTLLFARILALISPELFPAEPVNALSVFGAFLVVGGSLLAALRPGRR